MSTVVADETRVDRPGPHRSIHPRLQSIAKSPTLAIAERSNELASSGQRIYRLGLGQSPFPVPDPVVEALREHASEKDYLPVKGLPALRRAVAAHHARTIGTAGTEDDVLIGPGSKELMFLLQLVYAGDLLLPTPAWVSYAPQARMLGHSIVPLPTSRESRWQLDPATLDKACAQGTNRPRLLVLNYPNNPTGCDYESSVLQDLAEVARRHRVLVLSDEIYGEVHHRGEHTSIAAHYPEGTIVSGGLSKWCGAGGWRLGSFLFPKTLRWLLDRMASAASETYSAVSSPIQFAAVRAYEGGPDIDTYLTRSRRILRALGAWSVAQLGAARLSVAPPAGGFYLFPSFEAHRNKLLAHGIRTSAELCDHLLDETSVAALPGSCFGLAEEELYVRIAYVDFDGGAAITALNTLADSEPVDTGLLRTHCGPVMTGIERLCSWIA